MTSYLIEFQLASVDVAVDEAALQELVVDIRILQRLKIVEWKLIIVVRLIEDIFRSIFALNETDVGQRLFGRLIDISHMNLTVFVLQILKIFKIEVDLFSLRLW